METAEKEASEAEEDVKVVSVVADDVKVVLTAEDAKKNHSDQKAVTVSVAAALEKAVMGEVLRREDREVSVNHSIKERKVVFKIRVF